MTPDLGMFELAHVMTLTDADPRVIAVRLINIALELTGIVLLLVILYGGFLFLTSLGKPEKIKAAVATIQNGIIGAILVTTSWAIAKFVLVNIANAVNQ